MADYEYMANREAADVRYNTANGSLAVCNLIMENNQPMKIVKENIIYAGIFTGISPAFFAAGEETAGYITMAVGLLFDLLAAVRGISYSRAKKKAIVLTEELKGLEAKVQK